MELKKVSIPETICCALFPCAASRYKARAEEKRDFTAHYKTDGLQGTTVFVYLFSGLALCAGSWCYASKEALLSKYILGCASLSFAYLSAYGVKELYSRAVEFRNDYYNSDQVVARNAKKIL